jgi:gliding motility-associated-like protein
MKNILVLLALLLLAHYSVLSQCTNTSSFGSATASTTAGASVTISSCNYQTEYSTVSGFVAGSSYTLTNSSGGCITVHSGSNSGPVVSFGNAPLTFTAAASGTYYISYNTNCSSCGTATNCGTTTVVTNTGSSGGGSGCVGGANNNCSTADPFCTGTAYTYCNTTGVTGGGQYNCLYSTPNPMWMYLNIQNSGNIDINIAQYTTGGAPIDVDFALWGPFANIGAACAGIAPSTTIPGSYPSGTLIDCSFSGSATETANIPGAVAGQFYMLLITNYAGSAGYIQFSQSGGAGTTNCSIVAPTCAITSMTATASSCNASNQYTASGTINVNNPPTSGTLTVTNSCGGSQTFNAPFAASINYSIANVNATGAACTVTATFSALPTCTATQTYTSPTIPTVNAGPDQTVCVGSAVTLSGTGASTYTWTGGITNGAAFTPAATSNYTVTGTNAQGCRNTDIVAVTVNPLATANAGPAQSVCAAGSVTLAGTIGGAATSSTWSAPTGTFSNAGSLTSTYTPSITTGTVTLTLTTNDPAGPCNAVISTIVITVNPLPTINAGAPQTVCAGTAVTLAATGASTYSWNNGVTQGVAFTPAVTTTYTVTGTSAAGCTNTSTVNVTVNPTPVVSAGADVSICSGGSTTLTATGATTYSWLPGGMTTAAITVSPASTTTYTVTGTSLGCTSADAVTVAVAASAAINAGPDVTICSGASTTLTATGGVTYTWNNGLGAGNGFSVSPAATTTYTVTGTNAGACIGTDAMTVTISPLPTVVAGPAQTVCAGTAVTLTATGANTYSWNNGVTQGVAFTPAATTTYTVTGTSAAGCTNTSTVTVTVNPLPTVVAGAPQTVCAGAAVTLTASGALTYTWNNGVTQGVAFTPAATTTYTVTGTSAAGCTNTSTVTITVNPLPTVVAGSPQAVCAGTSVTLTATGASTYTWNNGVTQGVAFTPAATSTYTVTGTSAAGCINTSTVTVTVNPLPTVNAGLDQTVCAGTSVTLSGTGAATYTWDNGATNGVAFVPVSTQTYTVTGTTAEGCTNTDQVLMTVNPIPVVIAGSPQTICAGTSVTLTATGAATYSWNNGVNQGVAFVPVATTTYTVTGTTLGCTATSTVTITVNLLPIVNAGPDQTICEGPSVTLTATGASTYTWDNGVSNGIAFTPGVGTITYTVIGTSVAGCVGTDQLMVAVNPNPVPVINGPTQYCAGNFATLSTSLPFTAYSWTTGAATPTVNVTSADNPISVTVTNSFGCSATSPVFTVAENSVITANFSQTICQGQSVLIHGVSQSVAGVYSQTYTTVSGCDSVANVTLVVNPLPTVNAGVDLVVCTPTPTTLTATGAATYVWNNGNTNGVPFTQVIGSTTYTVSGTDANGCISADQVVVTVNPLPIVNAGIDQTVCFGASVSLSGTGAATYTWNNSVVNSISFIPAATTTYTITGTDANGCINTDQVLVTVNPPPIVGAGLDVTTCAGGSVTLNGSGAANYTWNNGITNNTPFTPAATTTYTVTGTDINGCINTDQVVVTVAGLPVIVAGIDQTVCVGTSVTLSGSGGSTYTWDNGVINGTPFIPVVGSLTYTVTGTDAGGCINTDQVVVTVNPLPVVGAGVDQTICIGASVTLNGSGASTYTWNNGVINGAAFNPVLTNTYTVTGTDVNGCINTDQVLVTVNPLPIVGAGADQTVCAGTAVTLNGSGASIYAWNNGVTNAVAFTPVATATYTVTGTDVNGCINTDQVQVIVNNLPPVNAGIDQVVCEGTSVILNGSGASTYSWNNSVTNGTAFIPAVGTITYTVTGTDANGCINTDLVDVTVNPLPLTDAGADQIVCIGTTVSLSGNNAATYSWDNGVTNNLAFTPSVGTVTYTVVGTSAFGCVASDQVVVTVNPLPVVFAGNNITICDGQSVTLTGSGAVNYTWNNGVLNGVQFTPTLGTTTYIVTGTSAAGCINTDQVNILVNPNPVISFNPDITSGCTPVTVNFTNTTPNSSNCVWTISNGTQVTGCGIVPVTFNQGGCYDVTLTTTATNGCTSTFTAYNLICVEDYPIAGFSTDNVEVSTLNTEVNFTNTSLGATTYEWSFGDGSAGSTDIDATHTYPDFESGNYEVTLVAMSPLGCADTAFAIINVQEELLFYVPNTFTPDVDKYNPIFQPVFTSGFDPYDYTLLIFNRWGEIIFESRNAAIGWNGTYGSNGEIQMCQDGTYTWKIEFKTKANDERKMVVGHVNLIR